MTAKVTVLLPVYNGERYLAPAVESILAQTFADFELLVVDDASTDRTADIVRSYNDSRIRLIRNPENLRLIAALNRGIEEARGEYVARMDADDISLPRRLETQVAFLDAHPDVGAVGAAVELIDEAGKPCGEVCFPPSHNLICWSLCFISPIAHPAATIRTSLLRKLGGYRPEALHCEDYDLWWRAVEVSRLANIEKVLLQLRKHADSITVRHGSVHDDKALEICRAKLEGLVRRDLPLGLVGAFMGRAPVREEYLSEGVEVLFRHARRCLGAPDLSTIERKALKRAIAAELFRWLDDPALAVNGDRARLERIRKHAHLASRGELAGAEKRLIRKTAAQRAVRVLVDAAPRAIARRAARLASSACRAVVPKSAQGYFTKIYERNIFGSQESRSGSGSTLEQTGTISREIPTLLREVGARSFLDAPCGDFNWMRHVDLGVAKYIGVDIVEPLIVKNQRQYGCADREFICRDLIRDALPAADVILCRDCLVHLNFRDAKRVLQNFKQSGSAYLLTTTFTNRHANVDLTGDMVWRTLNLQLPPFNLPVPLHVINENCTEAGGAYADKCLGLWRLSDISV